MPSRLFCDDDIAIRNAMDLIHTDALANESASYSELAEHWRPYRSVACWYLWQYLTAADTCTYRERAQLRQPDGSAAARVSQS